MNQALLTCYMRLFGNQKNPKWRYYLSAYWRYLMPTFGLRARGQRLLEAMKNRSDYPYILERIEYYCASFEYPLPTESAKLAEHCIGRQKVYFFDTHRYTRYFDQELRWNFLPGDIVHVPNRPTIVKSRPIGVDNRFSVLMKLDRVRHFTFVKDRKAWREKLDKIIFRGKVAGKDIRIQFMEQYHGHPMCDAADVSRTPVRSEWGGRKIGLDEHLKYKFIMALEGNDVASNLKWVMSSNSLAVMPKPTCETWFMEGTLIPNYHYVEIAEDLSDLEERVTYYLEHPEEAEAIIRHANEYVQQFWDNEREDLISLGVLQRYFVQTQQL